jgi:hypothetical protein
LLSLLCCTALERSREGDTWRGEVGEHLPRCSFGCSLSFPPLQLLPRVPAAPIVGWVWLFSLRQLAVTANWSGGSVSSLWALFVQVAAPAPQTSGGLLTVGPDVAELLTVLALRQPLQSPVRLHPD